MKVVNQTSSTKYLIANKYEYNTEQQLSSIMTL